MRVPTVTVTGDDPAARVMTMEGFPAFSRSRQRSRTVFLIVTNPVPGGSVVGDVSITPEGADAHSDLVCPAGQITEHAISWPPNPLSWTYEADGVTPKLPAVFASAPTDVQVGGRVE